MSQLDKNTEDCLRDIMLMTREREISNINMLNIILSLFATLLGDCPFPEKIYDSVLNQLLDRKGEFMKSAAEYKKSEKE